MPKLAPTEQRFLLKIHHNGHYDVLAEQRFLLKIYHKGYHDVLAETVSRVCNAAESMCAACVKRGLIAEDADSEGVYVLTKAGEAALREGVSR